MRALLSKAEGRRFEPVTSHHVEAACSTSGKALETKALCV